MLNFYHILSIPQDAEREEITLAYTNLRQAIGADQRLLQMAYRTLISPPLRAAHDRYLAGITPREHLHQMVAEAKSDEPSSPNPAPWLNHVSVAWVIVGPLHSLYLRSWSVLGYHVVGVLALLFVVVLTEQE